MTDSAILYDSSRCSACKGCQSACKCWNGLPSPLGKEAGGCTGSYQSPLELNGDTRLLISFNEKRNEKGGIEWAFARRSCMHCVNPACAAVCPSGTLHVDEASGMVAVSDEKCIGCQYCASACPFGVPHHYGPEPTVNKCTGCVDRIEQGRVPACVKTCQPGALNFGDRAEMLAIAHERVALLKSKGFDKAVVYGEDELDGLHVVSVAK
ncbi:MAG: 4Fe-4S binding protein, partial [Coriobacteriaceae bacterium]|nr:4Fe-4S binding protein [Coriobacteriaceae bacterium]